MLNMMKKQSDITFTENGALTYSHSGSDCLDLFFRSGAMRFSDDSEIEKAVIRAYAEDSEKTMKIIFFARDARGGLGERRFFRTAIKTLTKIAPEAVKRNIKNFAEYGRYDDLLTLLHTSCEKEAIDEIKYILDEDIECMKKQEPVSLLAKWLPSVNASSYQTVKNARKLCECFGMNEKEYRKTLVSLRKYIDILENRLRERDYTFEYSQQPSKAMFKYRKAFLRNDEQRYTKFITKVYEGSEHLNTSSLYPYDIVRTVLKNRYMSQNERAVLDATWNSLVSCGDTTENAIAVVDGSGSMMGGDPSMRPIDVALSLGIYFAEHNKGAFGGHFITFSSKPKIVKIKGEDIAQKVAYCSTFNEVANTNLEATFNLILSTAVKNKVSQSEMPKRLYIISDMEFDYCVEGGNSLTLFEAMKKKYESYGYRLPEIVFWNVNSRQSNIPVTMTQTGAALVSGATPAIFDMVRSGDISPQKVMNDIIYSERYEAVS